MLAQGITALVLCDELDRAWAMIERLSAAAQTSGSVMQYLVAASHAVCVETRRGDLVAAAADLRGSVERAAELGLTFVVIASLSYGTEVLLERPDAADLAALVETIQLGPLAETYIGAMAFELRGKLRFAAGQRTAAIADLRRAGAMIDSLGFTNAIGLTSWRGTLALMLDPAERDEALALADAELDNARRSGRPGRIGAALRVRGLLDQNSHTSCELLEESVAALTDSTARLQHARSLVDLGAARRRRGDRVSARAPLSEGMDLAARCGAVRLADRARAELAATGARPRRTKTSGLDALTPSELRVAQMAATGRTSNEIAQALFVTTATIATHLNRTYTKLGVNSRKQLADALARQPD
jgi:DNA-binding CsgD family transcriptional regulator